MEKYKNRQEAGIVLAKELQVYKNRSDVIVLALPRGGVPVAYEIAKELKAPLDVFIVRKLGVPMHRELAMGAIALGDVTVLNQDIINHLHISDEEINSVKALESIELKRRESTYRNNKPFPSLKNKTVILVDDGIATGATIRVAIQSLRQLGAGKLIVAVPVADKELTEKLETLVDEFYCPLRPLHFYAVGAWYDDFSQTEDEEVFTLLHEANQSYSQES